MQSIKILAFAGSAREDSLNKRLVRIAARGAMEEGVEVDVVDLADYPLPVLDTDLQEREGVPEPAMRLRGKLERSDGFIIASPEHNSSVSALLKNTIDWTTRDGRVDASLKAYAGKVAVIMSASPGGLGGLRGLAMLRAILQNIGVLVLPDQKAVSRASEAFDDEGNLKDAKQQEAILELGRKLARLAQKLK